MPSKNAPHNAVIFGADGLLGKEFARTSETLSGLRVRAYNKAAVDITDERAVQAALSRERPKVVINCAVKINVDACERESLAAWRVNALGAGIVFQSIRATGLADTVFVQMSTSDIFGGSKKRYTARDVPAPVNVYGWSKCGGEKLVEQIGAGFTDRFYIVRTGWQYGTGRDTFVDMAVEELRNDKPVSAIADQYNIPVWTRDTVRAVWTLVENADHRPSGIYHLGARVGEKGASKYDIAREAARILGLNASLVKKCSAAETFSVPRPRSAVLAHSPALPYVSWKQSLAEYLVSRYGAKKKHEL